MEAWGFKLNMGRLWALLYLDNRPLPAAEIGERLGLSTGAVSMLLTEMQEWGAIKRTWVPGERREFFEPETSIWKMVSRVFRERELVYIRETIEALETALKTLAAARARAAADEKRNVKFMEERLGSLLNLARVGEGLLGMLLAGEAIDVKSVRSFVARGESEE